MFKLTFIGIVLFLTVLNVTAQSPAEQSSKKLLLAIQKSKPDTNRISLQLKLGDYYLNKPDYASSVPVNKPEYTPGVPDAYKNHRDTAINLYNEAMQLSIKLHETDWEYIALARIAYYYEWVNDPIRCRQCYMRVIAYYHQKGNLGKEAHAWQLLANGHSFFDKFSNDVPETINDYQHARLLYLKNHELANAAGVLIDIGELRMTIKPSELGEKEIQQGLAEYKAVGYKQLQNTYSVLLQLEYDKGNYYRALDYCLQGIKSAAPGESVRNSSTFYITAARCNYAVKKYKEALDWARKAIAIDGGYPDHNYFLVETLLALNRKEEALLTLNDITRAKVHHTSWDTLSQYKGLALYYDKENSIDLAVRYYLKTLELAKKLIGGAVNEFYITCDNRIAENYLKANQAAKAEKYINDAALNVKFIKTTLAPDFLTDFYDNSYKYDLATGNYRAAIKDLTRRVKLQDSLFTVDKDNKMAELDIKYQTAQQEQSIKDFHNQTAIQRARLEKANLQSNITLGGVLVMILISALFYRNYRQKQAANNIITQKNGVLQHLLTEKEWLLKEVHHRVKNNLHTVICLLESQAQYLENDALKAIENSQHRIYAMSLIHQKLYQSDETKTIGMAEYISELVKSLEDGFGTANQINFKLNIDPVSLDISHAIPLGLIINEAVTNSIKYAFPNDRKGEISILLIDDGGQIKLELSDNGIGMPKMANETESGSLGILLMKGLSEDIDANISFEVDNGTRIAISFKPDDLTKTILEPDGTKEGIYL